MSVDMGETEGLTKAQYSLVVDHTLLPLSHRVFQNIDRYTADYSHDHQHGLPKHKGYSDSEAFVKAKNEALKNFSGVIFQILRKHLLVNYEDSRSFIDGVQSELRSVIYPVLELYIIQSGDSAQGFTDRIFTNGNNSPGTRPEHSFLLLERFGLEKIYEQCKRMTESMFQQGRFHDQITGILP